MQRNHFMGLRKGAFRLACAALSLLAAASAQAEVVAVAQQGNNRLELHDQAGHCLGRAKLAVFTDGVQRIPGCWLFHPEGVTVAFLDGDHLAVPLSSFRKPDDI